MLTKDSVLKTISKLPENFNLDELSPNLKKKIYESLFGEVTELFIEL